MPEQLHINVGLIALSRGFLTLEAFAQGMSSLTHNDAMSVRDLWLAPGRLDEEQLRIVLESIGPRDTMLFEGDESPTNLLQKVADQVRIPLGPATAPTAPSLAPVKIEPKRVSQPLINVDAPPPELFGARYAKLHTLGAGGLGLVTACEDTV